MKVIFVIMIIVIGDDFFIVVVIIVIVVISSYFTCNYYCSCNYDIVISNNTLMYKKVTSLYL